MHWLSGRVDAVQMTAGGAGEPKGEWRQEQVMQRPAGKERALPAHQQTQASGTVWVWVSGPCHHRVSSASQSPTSLSSQSRRTHRGGCSWVPMARDSVTAAPSPALTCSLPSCHALPLRTGTLGAPLHPPSGPGLLAASATPFSRRPNCSHVHGAGLQRDPNSTVPWPPIFRFCRPNKLYLLHNTNSLPSFINQTHKSQPK